MQKAISGFKQMEFIVIGTVDGYNAHSTVKFLLSLCCWWRNES